MKKRQYRQGDVLLEETNAIPPSAVLEGGPCILAHGEATGHAHRVEEEAGRIWVDVLTSGRRYLEMLREQPLDHEEHAVIPLPISQFEILRQRTYTRAAVQRVAD